MLLDLGGEPDIEATAVTPKPGRRKSPTMTTGSDAEATRDERLVIRERTRLPLWAVPDVAECTPSPVNRTAGSRADRPAAEPLPIP